MSGLFRHASRSDGSVKALIKAARKSIRRGEHEFAQSLLLKAMESADAKPRDLYVIADLFRKLGSTFLAIRCLNRAKLVSSGQPIPVITLVPTAKPPATASPGEDPVKAFLLLRRAFAETGSRELMSVAPELADAALGQVPPGDPRRVGVLTESCVVLRMAYEETGDPALLARAISDGRDAVRLAPADHEISLAARSHLGNALLAESSRTGDPALLTEAARYHEEVISRLPPGHPEVASTLNNLGSAMLKQVEQATDGELLDRAIATLRQGLAATARGSLPQANLEVSLSRALTLRASRSGDIAGLAEAARLLRAAIAIFPANDQTLPTYRVLLRELDRMVAAAGE
jgi:tetratricopeptide (TPR) repeat protein